MNCAGLGTLAPVSEHSLEEWNTVIGVCLTGTFLSVKHEALAMEATGRGGAIVNLASINAKVPAKGMSAYCSAKAGVEMLTRCAAMELGPKGIRVAGIGPGLVETPLTEYARLLPQIGAAYLESIPLGRVGAPSDVADAALFLVSARRRGSRARPSTSTARSPPTAIPTSARSPAPGSGQPFAPRGGRELGERRNDRGEPVLRAPLVHLADLAPLPVVHRRGPLPRRRFFGVLRRVRGHVHATGVVVDHQRGEELVELGTSRGAQRGHLRLGREPGHLVARDRRLHPAHRVRGLVTVAAPLAEVDVHHPDLGALVRHDLASRLEQAGIVAVAHVVQRHRDRLLVVRGHVLEEADVDRVAAGLRGLARTQSPADHRRRDRTVRRPGR